MYLFIHVRFLKLTCNVLQLQEVGDFEAQNCLPPLNLIRSTKLHLTTEPPIFCRCCYLLAFCLPCRCMSCQYWASASLFAVCVRVFLFFLKRWEIFQKQFLSALAKQALLQFLVCALACVNCKCACFRAG